MHLESFTNVLGYINRFPTIKENSLVTPLPSTPKIEEKIWSILNEKYLIIENVQCTCLCLQPMGKREAILEIGWTIKLQRSLISNE